MCTLFPLRYRHFWPTKSIWHVGENWSKEVLTNTTVHHNTESSKVLKIPRYNSELIEKDFPDAF